MAAQCHWRMCDANEPDLLDVNLLLEQEFWEFGLLTGHQYENAFAFTIESKV